MKRAQIMAYFTYKLGIKKIKIIIELKKYMAKINYAAGDERSCQSGNYSVIIRILFPYYPDENYRRIFLPIDNTYGCLVSSSA